MPHIHRVPDGYLLWLHRSPPVPIPPLQVHKGRRAYSQCRPHSVHVSAIQNANHVDRQGVLQCGYDPHGLCAISLPCWLNTEQDGTYLQLGLPPVVIWVVKTHRQILQPGAAPPHSPQRRPQLWRCGLVVLLMLLLLLRSVPAHDDAQASRQAIMQLPAVAAGCPDGLALGRPQVGPGYGRALQQGLGGRLGSSSGALPPTARPRLQSCILHAAARVCHGPMKV